MLIQDIKEGDLVSINKKYGAGEIGIPSDWYTTDKNAYRVSRVDRDRTIHIVSISSKYIAFWVTEHHIEIREPVCLFHNTIENTS
ncbi:MAG: hypothetical protein ACW99G_11290 [Candidatus Thorarchaeota archaeon]|jgi:hypothetical protein